MAVGSAVQVEVEGEGGQFGQAAVLSQQLWRAIGHVTERNIVH